ncbi:LodA/GoxA family CTQ-dependent oxidase [Bradyrhizobium sp. USDA 3650]
MAAPEAASRSTKLSSATIASLAIFPPLGVARVGNADGEGEYVIASEVVGGWPMLPNGDAAMYEADFRTADGKIKRQAVRFRIYATSTDGDIFEVTARDGIRIEWKVGVANLKAGWYEFNQALDLPRGISKPAQKRNVRIPVPGRSARLDIVPTPKKIEGLNKSGPEFTLDDGTFWAAMPVYLGELQTDDAGRLIFLGGRGTSGPFRKGFMPTTFANNDGWHDDVCDGPVRATVTFADGSSKEAQPAYVAVTPPNFAPGTFGLVTMDDTVKEVFRSQGWISAPTSTSFTKDIWPIFDRMTGLQWVNHGLFVMHGFGSALDARSVQVIAKMRDPGAAMAPWRARVFKLFRDPAAAGAFDEAALPQIFGDAYGENPSGTPPDALNYLSVTRTQFEHLGRWAAGNFVDDWTDVPAIAEFGKLSPAEQIDHLNRAPLHECLGGPFHPGIELTWTMRIPHIWAAAYRLKVLPTDDPAKQDFGPELSPQVCCGPGGPFDGVAAGALTRFLGVPWQTDGASCNSDADYSPSTFLSMPTFWGARVPDQVMSFENYLIAAAIGKKGNEEQFSKYLMARSDWLRDVRGFDYYTRIAHMVGEWWELGMVLAVKNPSLDFPDGLRVEQGRNRDFPGSDPKPGLVAFVEDLRNDQPTQVAQVSRGLVLQVPQAPKRQYRQGEI